LFVISSFTRKCIARLSNTYFLIACKPNGTFTLCPHAIFTFDQAPDISPQKGIWFSLIRLSACRLGSRNKQLVLVAIILTLFQTLPSGNEPPRFHRTHVTSHWAMSFNRGCYHAVQEATILFFCLTQASLRRGNSYMKIVIKSLQK
jgi:hypothetical protein